MKILAIETSCDETAISIIEAKGGSKKTEIKILSNIVLSQVKLHAQYGGVFPNLAKREHAKNLIPVLKESLKKANLLQTKKITETEDKNRAKIENLLQREPDMASLFLDFIPTISTPKIDIIVVTHGPGLEPALWVGVNFAKALSLIWNKPLIPVNHMEGHIFAGMIRKSGAKKYKVPNIKFPAITLLISGGHTEIVLMKDFLKYKIIGQTRDDASGEAFDKVARMLSLPYPGGPEVSRLAEKYKSENKTLDIKLPRPMIDSKDFDFSFSGLKTSVLYLLQKLEREKIEVDQKIKEEICYEFEEAVTEVLVKKTIKATEKYKGKAVILGGGVSANKRIRQSSKKKIKETLLDVELYLPDTSLTGDNALMIAIAGYFKYLKTPKKVYKNIKAEGNLRLS